MTPDTLAAAAMWEAYHNPLRFRPAEPRVRWQWEPIGHSDGKWSWAIYVDGKHFYLVEFRPMTTPTTERTADPTPEALKAAADALPITWGRQLVIDVARALDSFARSRAEAAVEKERERIAAAIREPDDKLRLELRDTFRATALAMDGLATYDDLTDSVVETLAQIIERQP